MDIRDLLIHIRDNPRDRAVQRDTGVDRRTVQRYRRWATHHSLLTDPLPSLAELHALLATTLDLPPPPQNVSSVEPYRAQVVELRRQGTVLPMSRNILLTLAMLRVLDIWNEWLWPLVTITKYEYRPMALQVFYLANDVGPNVGWQMAGYTLASIPMLLLFILFSRNMIEGLSSGAVRG